MRSMLMTYYYGVWASLASLPQILRVVIVVFALLIPAWCLARAILPKILFLVWRLLNVMLMGICLLTDMLLSPLRFIARTFYVRTSNNLMDKFERCSRWLLNRPNKWKFHFWGMIAAGMLLSLLVILPNLIGRFVPNECYYYFSFLHNAYLKIEGPALKRASNYQQIIYIEDANFSEDVDSLNDVSTEAFSYDAVDWAVRKGITQGTSETTFSPDERCTRVHMLMFLWRASGSPEPTIDNPYDDVRSDSYFSKAAIWAYENQLITNTTLNGGSFCTRAEAVTYLWKLAGQPRDEDENHRFDDVDPESEYFDAVSWSVTEGLTASESDGSFFPDQICTREQVITFMYKYFVM